MVMVGGKRAEAQHLSVLLPHHSCYVEVFGGGASVLLAKRPSDVEVYNDLNGELVNFFRVLKEQPDEFRDSWRWCLVSREEFNLLREADVHDMTPIQRAYRFLYLNRGGFGGDMEHTPRFGCATDRRSKLAYWLEGYEEWIGALHHRLRDTYIENAGWQEVIERYDNIKNSRGNTVFFCDPPYLGTWGYEVGTMDEQAHVALAKTLSSLKGRFLLTINDTPILRSLYAGCDITERSKVYSIGGDAETRRYYRELIISNYPLPEQKQARLF